MRTSREAAAKLPAVAKAAAVEAEVPLYRWIGGTNAHVLPVPLMNLSVRAIDRLAGIWVRTMAIDRPVCEPLNFT